MSEPTREEVFAALEKFGGGQLADLLVCLVTVAAERNKPALHKALSKVFDLGEAAERMSLFDLQARECWAVLEETKERLQAVNHEFKDVESGNQRLHRLEQQYATLVARVERLEDRCGRMAKFLNAKYAKGRPT